MFSIRKLNHLKLIALIPEVQNNPLLMEATLHELALCEKEEKEKTKTLVNARLYRDYPHFTQDLETLRLGGSPWRNNFPISEKT